MSSVNSFQGFFYDWITQDLRSTTRKLSTSSSITVKRKARRPINFLLIVQYTHANTPINHAVNPLYLFITQVKMNDAIACASYQCMPLRLRFLSEPPTPVDVFQPRRAIVKNERRKHWVHRYPPISLQWTESLFLRVPLNDLPSVTVKFCFLSRDLSTPSRKNCADQWPRFSKPRRKWKLKLLTDTVHWILEDRLTLSIRSRDMEKREWNSVIY